MGNYKEYWAYKEVSKNWESKVTKKQEERGEICSVPAEV